MWDASRNPVEWLNQLWNDRGTLGPPRPTANSATEATFMEILDRLDARDDAQLPDPIFVSRLERLLAATHPHSNTLPLAVLDRPSPNGRLTTPLPSLHAARPSGIGRAKQPRLLATLATAALVVLALVGSLVSFREPIQQHLVNSGPIMLPAIEGTPDSTPQITPPVIEDLWETQGGPDVPLDGPFGMAVDPRGNLWVADTGNARFQIFAPDGSFLETWGSAGSGPGQFNFHPYDEFVGMPGGYGDVTFDRDGNIYVADTGNFRIQKFAPDRAFLRQWGSKGTEAGQFLDIFSVTVGPDGTIFVADENRNDVQRFDADGAFLNSIGGPGAGPGKLSDTESAAVDASGRVWITDYNRGQIQRYSADGQFLDTWGAHGFADGQFQNPVDLAFDASGRVWVVDIGKNNVQVFSQDGQYLATLGRSATKDRRGFIGTIGIALSDAGHVYVSNWSGDSVSAFQVRQTEMPGTPMAVATPPRDEQVRGTPAAVATPSIDRPFTASTLLDLQLPAGKLGRQSGSTDLPISWIYEHYAIAPGTRVIYPDNCSTPDVTVRYVLQGRYAVKANGLVQVIRHAAAGADAIIENVPPRQEVLLEAGDALIYHNLTGDMFEGFRNPGPDRVELLEWEWLEDACRGLIPGNMELRWDASPDSSNVTVSPVPVDTSRPLTFRLREVTAAPGTTLPQDGPDGPGLLPPGFPGIDVAAAEQGRVTVADAAPKETFHPVGSTTPPPGGMVSGAAYLPADSTRTISSSGDQSLRLYELTIVNTDSSSSPPNVTSATPGATPMD